MEKETALANISKVMQYLDQARDLSEILEVRDIAVAIHAYSVAKKSHDTAQMALELKLRSERKAGGFLRDDPEIGKGKCSKLLHLGINRTESSRWQRIALIPDELFEEFIGKATHRSQSALLSEASRIMHYEPVKAPPLPDGVFNVIYADPPWRYQFSPTYSREVEKNYPTMSLEEICAIKIPVAEDAILFLWATSPKLEEAMMVVREWGFDYRTSMVWVKDRIGMGHYVRGQHEFLLICRKGGMRTPDESDRPPSVIVSPRREHSRKPDGVYELIETMYPLGTYLELFSREDRINWTMWGYDTR